MNDNRWISIKNAAIVLQISRRTVHRLIVRYEVPTSREGRETIVILRDLNAALDKAVRGGYRPRVAIDNQSQVS